MFALDAWACVGLPFRLCWGKPRRRFALVFAKIAVFLKAAAPLFVIDGWVVLFYVEGVVSFHKEAEIKK